MHRADLVRMVGRRIDQPQWAVDQVLDGIIDVIGLALSADEEVMIRGFGKFEPRAKVATVKKNPMTGEEMKIPERRTTVFLPSSTLKRRLNDG